MRDPKVSVIIPTYYRNEYLKSAIQSALDQSYDPIEVIVVDDSGNHHAEPLCSEYEVKYLAHEDNRGAQQARITGIKAASGHYIQLLDDDDQIKSDKVERQVQLLQRQDGVGVVYCGLEKDGEIHRPNSSFRGCVLKEALIFNHYPCQTSTMLIDRNLMDEVMPLSKGIKDEVGLIIELAALTEFDYIDEALVMIGTHDAHRGLKPSFGKEGIKLVENYRDLYNQFPAQVRHQALHHQYRRYARILLADQLWSTHAIVAATYACYFGYVGGVLDGETMALLLSSIFGKAGFVASRTLYRWLIR